jgi:hypothetical protein
MTPAVSRIILVQQQMVGRLVSKLIRKEGHYATSQKVAGSIPGVITGFIN